MTYCRVEVLPKGSYEKKEKGVRIGERFIPYKWMERFRGKPIMVERLDGGLAIYPNKSGK